MPGDTPDLNTLAVFLKECEQGVVDADTKLLDAERVKAGAEEVLRLARLQFDEAVAAIRGAIGVSTPESAVADKPADVATGATLTPEAAIAGGDSRAPPPQRKAPTHLPATHNAPPPRPAPRVEVFNSTEDMDEKRTLD